MSRRRRSAASPRQEMRALGARVVAAGAAMALIGLVVGGNKLFAGLASILVPLGLFLLAVGGAILWFTRTNSGPPAAAREASRPQPAQRPADPEHAPLVDRTPTELLRRLDGVRGPELARVAPSRWGADVFDVIEWRRFEAVVERLFQQAGFETRSQSHGADMGVDVWLYSRSQTDRPVSVVQCKHWSGKRVGVDKIRELRGVMAAHGVARGQFATTSSFTPDAVEFGKANAINLLDVQRLLDLIAQRTPQQQTELLAVALEGDYWRPTCVNCGVKLVEREAKKDGKAFWGCVNYRSGCRTTMPMRDASGLNA
jgi:restriction system protein